jgi:general secretion pathway protein G
MKLVLSKNQNEQKGFTLIELLVVIAIISLLSSVVFASLNSARVKARDARRKADLQQLLMAYAQYVDDLGGFLPLSNECGSSRAGAVHGLYVTDCPDDSLNWYIGDYLANHGYISAPPADPLGGTGDTCRYYYYTDTSGTYFQFSAYLEDPSPEDLETTTNGAPPNWSNCSYGNYRVYGTL